VNRKTPPEKVLGRGFTQLVEGDPDRRGWDGLLGTVKSYRSNANPKTAYSRQLTKSGDYTH
jgi:hypothetical protein